jgi:hypothetical protein
MMNLDVQQKRGRRSPPFLAGAAAYRFLPPFFFPPLADFFAIALYPPLRVGSSAKSFDRIAAPLPSRHAGGASGGAHRIAANSHAPRARGVHLKKSGVLKMNLTPPGPVGGG